MVPVAWSHEQGLVVDVADTWRHALDVAVHGRKAIGLQALVVADDGVGDADIRRRVINEDPSGVGAGVNMLRIRRFDYAMGGRA